VQPNATYRGGGVDVVGDGGGVIGGGDRGRRGSGGGLRCGSLLQVRRVAVGSERGGGGRRGQRRAGRHRHRARVHRVLAAGRRLLRSKKEKKKIF
jgi:hypothetical protein